MRDLADVLQDYDLLRRELMDVSETGHMAQEKALVETLRQLAQEAVDLIQAAATTEGITYAQADHIGIVDSIVDLMISGEVNRDLE